MKTNLLILLFTLPLRAEEIGQTPLPSPDGAAKISLISVTNIRLKYETEPEAPILLLTKNSVVPLAAFATKAGVNQGAWTGSSRYLFLATGNSKDQELVVVYEKSGIFHHEGVSLESLYEFGEKNLPNSVGIPSGSMPHDGIAEIRSGKNDSVTILYHRTKYPKSFVVPVTLTVADGKQPSEVSMSFGDITWVEKWEDPLPTLDKLKPK